MTESEQPKQPHYTTDMATEARIRSVEGENVTLTANLGAWMKIVGAVLEMKKNAIEEGLSQESVDVLFPTATLVRQLMQNPAGRKLILTLQEHHNAQHPNEKE